MGPFERHRASPTTLDRREQELRSLAESVVDAEAVTDAAYDPATAAWAGIAAAELRSAPEPVLARAHSAAEGLVWAAAATRVWSGLVRTFNDVVNDLRREREQVPTEVERYVTANGFDRMPGADLDSIRQARRAELLGDLERRWYEARDTHIDDGSRTVAGMFAHGPTWDNLQLARHHGGLGEEAGLTGFLTTVWAAAAAPAEALRLAALFNDPNYQPSQQELQDFHDLLEQYAEDEAFWYEFLTALGPEGTLLLSGSVAFSVPMPALGDAPGDPTGAELASAVQALLGGGIALATAARGTTTPYGAYHPAEHELPERWILDLMAAGRTVHTVTGDWDGAPWPAEVYGYQLLGPLLRHGDYDARFLGLVGGDMIDFELAHGDSRLWTETGGAIGSQFRLDWAGGADPTHPTGVDPILGLLSAMERNPEGALAVLHGSYEYGIGTWSDGTPKTTGNEDLRPPPDGFRLPRLDYLLTDREWPTAWANHQLNQQFLQDNPEARHLSPGPAMLGEVLVGAGRVDDPQAAELVALIFYEIGTDEQAMGYPNGSVPGSSPGEPVPPLELDLIDPSMRTALATIISDYIIDVNGAVRDSGSSMPGGRGADIPGDYAIMAIVDLGKDQGAYEIIRDAQVAYSGTAYEFYFSDAADPRPDTLEGRIAAAEGVATSHGAVMGAADFGAGTARWREQWDADVAANAPVDAAFNVAGYVVGAGSEGMAAKAPGSGYLAGELVGGTLDAMRSAMSVDSSGLAHHSNNELFADGRELSATMAEAALYQSGRLEGLGEFRLLDENGDPKPMVEWTGNNADQWERYKEDPGAGTAAKLADAAGSAYDSGRDRARKLMQGGETE